jgi:hypothetical protein
MLDWEPFSICWDQRLKGFEADEYMDGYISWCHKKSRARVAQCHKGKGKSWLARQDRQTRTGFQKARCWV